MVANGKFFQTAGPAPIKKSACYLAGRHEETVN